VLAKHWRKQLGTRTAHCTLHTHSDTQTLRHSRHSMYKPCEMTTPCSTLTFKHCLMVLFVVCFVCSQWKLCDPKKQSTQPSGLGEKRLDAPPGTQDADHQLCGATYAELYALDGKRNQTMIADTLRELDSEISNNQTSLWSWVDATFMAMNTWARIGSVTGEQKYFDQMFYDFSAAALEVSVDKVLWLCSSPGCSSRPCVAPRLQSPRPFVSWLWPHEETLSQSIDQTL
jgi:hypothetical protein